MPEILLSQSEIDLLPIVTQDQLKEGYIFDPNGLVYDSDGYAMGRQEGYIQNPETKYRLKIIPTMGVDPPDEDLDDQQPEEEQTLTDRLINLVLSSRAKIFHDTFGVAMIAINGDGTKVTRLSSKDFKTWLANAWWKKYSKGINGSIIETAVRTLEGQAIHEGDQIKLHNRTASIGADWFYDLTDGQVVKITKAGWEVMEEPPIVFIRYNHQQKQVGPISSSDYKIILEYLPSPDSEEEQLLLLVWLVSAFMPDFYHPILLVHGEQGSRKTTLFKLLRSLIDPSVLETLTLRSELAEFIQQASHNYFLPIDNLSILKPELSDLLCRLVTGEGFSKRELYSDDDDKIYSFQRIVGLNGINLIADKPDLLDRSIIIRLSPPKQYEDEQILAKKFIEAKPKLLGVIFDLIVKARQELLNVVDQPELAVYRMAGFTRHALAISRAMGFSDDQMINALKFNRERQHGHVLESSVLLGLIVKFMENRQSWIGTAQELHEQLKKGVESEGSDIKNLPAVNWITRKVMEILPTLRSQGIDFGQKNRNKQRQIELTNRNELTIHNGEKSFDFDEIALGLPFKETISDRNVGNDSKLLT